MASVLEGFLVKLGFDVDKGGMSKFQGAVSSATSIVAGLAKTAAATGVAVAAAFVKTTRDVNKLYVAARNSGSSISGMVALQRAVERVGGNAEVVGTAFADFTGKVKQYGRGFEQVLKNQLGVSLYDAQGNVKDMSAVFMEMRNELSRIAKTNPGLAKAKADAVGLGAAFDDLMKKDFPAEWERASKEMKAFGSSIDDNARKAHDLTNNLNAIWDTFSTGTKTLAMDVLETTGIDKWVAHLAEATTETVPALLKTLKTGMKSFFEGKWSIGSVFKKLVDDRGRKSLDEADLGDEEELKESNPELYALIQKNREKRKNTKTVSDIISDEYQKNLAETKGVLQGGEKAEQKTGSRTAQKQPKTAQDAQKQTVPADTLPKDAGKHLKPIKQRVQIVYDDDGNPMEIPVQESESEGKQTSLQGTASKPEAVGAVSVPTVPKYAAEPGGFDFKFKPKNDIEKQALDAEINKLNAFAKTMLNSQTSVSSGAVASSAGVTDAHTENKTQNVTVNQTITVQGSADPMGTAKAITQDAKQSINRYSSANSF